MARSPHSKTSFSLCLAGILLLPLLLLPSCDNVGLAFDPRIGGQNDQGISTVQRMVVQGDAVDGRPKVRKVFPSGNGWPGTVPVVVEFNETINEASVAPQGADPNLFIRLRAPGSGTGTGTGTGTGNQSNPNAPPTTSPPLAVSYDFLMGGRVVVIRPTAAFDTSNPQAYEVVVNPALRDSDGVRFGGKSAKVVGSFTPDQDSSIDEGQILTVLPFDNSRDQLRESSVYAIFTKPATQNSVKTGTGGNFVLRTSGGVVIDGDLSFPIRASGFGGGSTQDGRVVRLVPKNVLAGDSWYEIVVDSTIGFGQGSLDFKGRTPFASFLTLAPEDITAVRVGNAAAGSPDKVNRGNLETLLIDVDVPGSALAGDRVNVRVYGLDPASNSKDTIAFLEVSGWVPANGAQTVTIDFAGKLGTLAKPTLAEGDLTIAAQLVRGGQRTGYVLADSQNEPELDITAPTLTTPAADAAGNREYVTDHEFLTFFGLANEGLMTASLVLDSTPAPAPSVTSLTAFGFGSDGRFLMKPTQLGRRTSPLGFSLTLTDTAGNISTVFTGEIVQRGLVTGMVSPAGVLTVEAYDQTSLKPVPGVRVLVEPGMPQKPASGRVQALSGSHGRASFTGLGGTKYSVTLIGKGYHLLTILDCPASFLSLPLRPITGATATISGTAAFVATPGATAMVGCNIIDDVLRQEIQTTSTSPMTIPSTPIRANRPYVLSAFSGSFEPTAVSTFSNFACALCGPTGTTKEALKTGVAAGENGAVALALVPSTGSARDLAAAYQKDFSASTGLDLGNLVSTPTVRVMTSLFGISGQSLMGVGFATQVGASTSYEINATYSLSSALVLFDLGPKFWISTEATDKSGNVARHKRIVADTNLGTTFAAASTPGISTISAPGGASSGSPSVTFQDRLDPSSILGGFGFHQLTGTSAGRMWRLVLQDGNSTGAVTVQFPDLAGVTEPGLAAGSWTLRAETSLIYSGTIGLGDYVLEELRREEVTYARAADVSFTVN